MPLDIYSTRAQLAAIELMPREYSFLYDTFVRDMGPVEDDKAIYDFRKGTRQMAPIVHPGTGGVLMTRGGYETREIEFCTIAPERIITNNDLKSRSFGENVFGAMTPEQRAKKMQAKDLTEMRLAIQRRREWMARMVLLLGKLNVFRYTSEGRDLATLLSADYQFTNNFTPATAWNQASATIDADMRTIFDLVYEGSGFVDIIVMAPDVADAMIANSNYIKQFDYRNVNMGEINARYVGQGVRFIGFNSDGVEMYSLSGKFIDDDGTTKPVMPSGKLIAGAKGILKCPYGPVTQVESNGADAMPKTYIKSEVPLRYGSIDSNSVKNRLTSRPTIIPFNVDAWCVASVL
ncbi:MAG: major capsid protein [Eubacteriales bacterium]|nr:major capsid protein [Eubacteriales bacterium]MDD4513735.1 major capsid protein [Eubacteriales bacterium]